MVENPSKSLRHALVDLYKNPRRKRVKFKEELQKITSKFGKKATDWATKELSPRKPRGFNGYLEAERKIVPAGSEIGVYESKEQIKENK